MLIAGAGVMLIAGEMLMFDVFGECCLFCRSSDGFCCFLEGVLQLRRHAVTHVFFPVTNLMKIDGTLIKQSDLDPGGAPKVLLIVSF